MTGPNPDSNPEPGITDETRAGLVRRGFSWSLANSAIRRVWTFAFGIIMARLLVPADFGVFVIALATLTILQSMNDLGTAVGVIQWQGDPSRAARTATSISIGGSVVLYAMVFLLAPVIATQLDSPQAVPVLRLLTFAVVLDGFSGIPNALLERSFLQKRRLVADLNGFAVNFFVAISLAMAGFGPWALTWGIVAGNATVTVAIMLLAPSIPLPGWNQKDARALVKFGLPLAGASLLVFVMLNVDYLVLANIVGATALGLYLLAFNVSSWPSNLLTVAVRSVSIPAFSQLVSQRDRLNTRFAELLSLLLTLTFPVVILLGILGRRLISFVYGDQWIPAATALFFLALLSVIRVGLDFCYDFLIAIGRTRVVMALQGLWVVALIPALIVGATLDGIRGAAIAHLAVAGLLMVPVFASALHRANMPLRPLVVNAGWPIVAMLAMAGVVLAVNWAISVDFWALAIGGVVGSAVYVTIALRLWRGRTSITEVQDLWRGAPVAG